MDYEEWEEIHFFGDYGRFCREYGPEDEDDDFRGDEE